MPRCREKFGVEEIEAKHKQEMSTMDKKLQLLLRTVINQNNSGLNMDALTAFLTTPGDANGVQSSSTPTHAPNSYEPNIGLANQNLLDDNLLDVKEDEDAYFDS